MARLFSIYFEFKGAPYSAMVSVRDTAFFTEYTLNHFDDALIHMLPGNKIISTPEGSMIFQNAAGLEQTPLMETILRAVSNHMQGTEV